METRKEKKQIRTEKHKYNEKRKKKKEKPQLKKVTEICRDSEESHIT